MYSGTITFTEAARRLKKKGIHVSYKTISEIVEAKRIRLVPHIPNGVAMGLDAAGFRIVEETLSPVCVSA